MADRDFRRRN
jgi:hypothetical protein